MTHDPECRSFERWLEARLAGSRPDAAADGRARAHRAVCAACRDLEGLMRGPATGLPRAPRDFARAVLERTSGPACPEARRALAAAVDDPPSGLSARLLAGHLATCADCGGLESVLRAVLAELPGMARLPAGPAFLEGVMRATSRKVPGPARHPIAPLRWLAQAWRRPRFALEAAYLGTVLVWGLVALPLSPLYGSPGATLDGLRPPGPSAALADAHARAVGLGHQAWSLTAAEGRDSVARLRAELARERRRVAARGAVIVHNAEALARALAAGDGQAASRAWSALAENRGTPAGANASDSRTTDDDSQPNATTTEPMETER